MQLKIHILHAVGISMAMLLLLVQPLEAGDLYFVDAHSQVDETVDLNSVLSLMQQAGVRHTILSTRGKRKGSDLVAFAARHASRITPAVRTKGASYAEGSPKYFRMLDAQVASGKYGAMAEVLLYHAKKGGKAPEYRLLPQEKVVVAALQHARRHDWPFVIHIEFAALSGQDRQALMQAMETLLKKHPRMNFVLTHMGQLGPEMVSRLIDQHENLYFHTGWTNPAAVGRSNQPWVNLFEGERFAAAWRELMRAHPDRFVFALDNVFAGHWQPDFYQEQVRLWKTALSDLPAEAARQIAHGNAERLWRLPVD